MTKYIFFFTCFFINNLFTQNWISFSDNIQSEQFQLEYFPENLYDIDVANNGNTACIGDFGYDSSEFDRVGKVTVYDYIDTRWQIRGNPIFFGDEVGDFGRKVAITQDGNTVVATSTETKNSSGENIGSASVFEWKNGSWLQKGATILGIENIGYGASVTISDDGNTIVVGAPESWSRIFTYKFIDGEWQLVSSFRPEVVFYLDIGKDLSLAANGLRLAVGLDEIPTTQNDISSTRGVVIVYDWINNEWAQSSNPIVGEQRVDGILSGIFFGASLNINPAGTTLVVGAPQQNSTQNMAAGAVTVYSLSGNEWVQIGNTIYGEEFYEEFGTSVAISQSGDRIISGVGNFVEIGKARVYDLENGDWRKVGEDIQRRDDVAFGNIVDIASDGKIIFVGGAEFVSSLSMGTITSINEMTKKIDYQLITTPDGFFEINFETTYDYLEINQYDIMGRKLYESIYDHASFTSGQLKKQPSISFLEIIIENRMREVIPILVHD